MSLDNVVTAAEAASMAGVSVRTIERHCANHWESSGDARKSNGTWLIKRQTIIDYYGLNK